MNSISWENFKFEANRFLQPNKHNKYKRYLFPCLLVVIIFPLKLLLQYYSIEGAAYLLSTFIVILSSWYGGLGPGIFSTIIAGILSNFFFLEPQLAISFESIFTTIIFILQGVFISMISEAKRHADLQKDEFISFASHELKNPLSVVKGYLEVTQKLPGIKKEKKAREYLFITETYIDKLTYLINELLDVTKIESGKLSLHKERISMVELVEELVRDQQLLSDTHKILFERKSNKEIYGDRLRISQVIINMITNAIKYSPGKKKIKVKLENKDGSVVISVQDYGIGLSDTAQTKVFERFYRVSNVSANGLGLGLYISQQIAKLHNGQLYIKSIKKKGTTFYFKIPAIIGE